MSKPVTVSPNVFQHRHGRRLRIGAALMLVGSFAALLTADAPHFPLQLTVKVIAAVVFGVGIVILGSAITGLRDQVTALTRIVAIHGTQANATVDVLHRLMKGNLADRTRAARSLSDQ